MYGDYRKLEPASSEGLESTGYDILTRNHSAGKKSKSLIILKYSLLSLFSTWGFINIIMCIFQRIPIFQNPKDLGCYCGTSSAEAKAMGCKYDSLAAAWLPDHCRDDELTAEFDAAGDGPDGTWLYWKDKNHTIPITTEEIKYLGDSPGARFHMDYSWHEVHCLYYWRKEHRFRFNGKILDPRSDSEEHIKHCGMVWRRKITYGHSVYLDVDSLYGEFEYGLHAGGRDLADE